MFYGEQEIQISAQLIPTRKKVAKRQQKSWQNKAAKKGGKKGGKKVYS